MPESAPNAPTTMHSTSMLPLAALGVLSLAPADDPPREFGHVDWGRKLEPALARSADSGKPVLLLFQEVPG